MTGPRPTMSVLVRLKDELSAGWDRITGKVEGAKGSWGGLGGVVGGVAKAFAAVGGAMALGAFFKSAIEEATEAEAVHAKLRQAIENTGGSFTDLEGPIDASINGMKRLTKFTDDDLADALGAMTLVSGDARGSLDNLGLAADLAAAKNIDLKTAAELVGKVMAGETGTLKRYGIVVGEGADAIEVMRERFAGFAEREGKTFGGTLTRITNGWADFKEAVGTAILSNDGMSAAGEGVIGVLTKMEQWISDNSGAISSMVTGVIDLAENMWGMITPVVEAGKAVIEAANALGILQGAFRFVQVAVLGTQTLLEAFFTMFKSGIGGILYVVGGAADIAGGLLRKLGFDVGDAAAKVRDAGQRMVQEAVASGSTLGARTSERFWSIMGEQERAETARTDVARTGSNSRVRIAEEEGEQLTRAQRETNAALERAGREYEAIFGQQAPAYIDKATAALAAHTEVLKRSNTLDAAKVAQLTAQRAELLQLLPVLQRLAVIETDEQRVELIEDQAEQLRVVSELYDRTTAVVRDLRPGTEAWTVATARQRDLQLQMRKLTGEIGEELFESKQVQGMMNTALLTSRLIMGDLAAGFELVGDGAKRTADGAEKTHDELVNAARGAVELGVEFLGLDEASGRVLQNVITVADTLKDGFGSLAAGDIIGAVGAVAGILGSIFGGNSEHKQIVRENSRRMVELRDGIREQVRLSTPGGQIATAISALSSFVPLFNERMQNAPSGAAGSIASVSLFQAANQAGISVAVIDQIAEELGISIRDSEGRVIGQAVGQLLSILRQSDLTGFGNTFGGRMDQLDAEFGVRGTVSAQEQLRRRLDVLLGASPIFGQNLSAFDLGTSGGLEGMLRALEALVPNLGGFGIGDFGQLGREETIEWATRLAELVREVLEGSATTTTAGLSDQFLADTLIDAGVGGRAIDAAGPDLAREASAELTRAADGIARLEDRLVEVRDALRTGRAGTVINGLTVEQNPRLDDALDTILEEVDQRLQQRVDDLAFANGGV